MWSASGSSLLSSSNIATRVLSCPKRNSEDVRVPGGVFLNHFLDDCVQLGAPCHITFGNSKLCFPCLTSFTVYGFFSLKASSREALVDSWLRNHQPCGLHNCRLPLPIRYPGPLLGLSHSQGTFMGP